jgi:integrase
MTIMRIKGIKRYQVKGRWFTYHRKTGTRLVSEFGTGAFFAELAALERSTVEISPVPGTLGGLFTIYRASPRFLDLAAATQIGYGRMIDLVRPLHNMPLVELTPSFVAGLRDRVAAKHGRRQANYVMAVISVACEFGKERGLVDSNPVKGLRRVPRERHAVQANRPWTEVERRVVLAEIPIQLRLPVALAMFTGLRKGDVLALEKAALRDNQIWHQTSKTGVEISLPVHPHLARLIKKAPAHDAATLAATTAGSSWTVSGFNASFIKAITQLRQDGKVGRGLTFHGLRHTVGTLLIEAGVDLDTVRRWLGQKTLAMAIHYSQTADMSKQMRDAMNKLDPLGRKVRTKVSNPRRKVSNRG